ncbi:hypothetical protein ACTS9T_03630 [Empedobacter falsenii]
MKKIIYLLIIFPCLLFAQNNNGEKTDKNELESLSRENKELKEILKKVNEKYFNETFSNFYSDDYFKDQGYKKLNDSDKNTIDQSKLMSESILAVEDNDKPLYKRAVKSKVFNQYLITLDSVYENVLSQKYDSIKVVKAIGQLKNLAQYDEASKMETDKVKFIKLLSDYKEKSCNVTSVITKIHQNVLNQGYNVSSLTLAEFNNYINKGKDAISIQDFIQLTKEKDNYPYLVNKINEVKKKPVSFNQSDFIDKGCEIRN